MEERTYNGVIDINDLANHLIATFDQSDDIVAQKVGQGDQIMVQIGRAKFWTGKIRNAIGISLSRLTDGVHVAVGQSNWLPLDDPGVGAMLIGSFFFPPLILLPLMRGIRNYTLYEEIWNVIDEYCAQASAAPSNVQTHHAMPCQNCGTLNDEDAGQCHLCGMPLYRPAGISDEPYAQTTNNAVLYKPRMVTCPRCEAVVPAGKYCSNCASALPLQIS